MIKEKQCGVCLQYFPSMWKAKTKTEPQKCKSCALKPKVGDVYKENKISYESNGAPYHKEFRVVNISPSKPRSPIKPISDKQVKINAAYKVLHKAFMERNPFCVARFEEICTGQAKELHHSVFGSNKRKHYLNETTFRAVCSECHRHIHDKMDSDELVKLGLRILD